MCVSISLMCYGLVWLVWIWILRALGTCATWKRSGPRYYLTTCRNRQPSLAQSYNLITLSYFKIDRYIFIWNDHLHLNILFFWDFLRSATYNLTSECIYLTTWCVLSATGSCDYIAQCTLPVCLIIETQWKDLRNRAQTWHWALTVRTNTYFLHSSISTLKGPRQLSVTWLRETSLCCSHLRAFLRYMLHAVHSSEVCISIYVERQREACYWCLTVSMDIPGWMDTNRGGIMVKWLVFPFLLSLKSLLKSNKPALQTLENIPSRCIFCPKTKPSWVSWTAGVCSRL